LGVEAVESFEELGGAFDLYAPEQRSKADFVEVAGVEDYVVTFAVSVGLGDAEAEVVGLEGEGEFGEFSAALGDEFAVEGLGGRGCGGLGSGRLFSGRLGWGGLCWDRLYWDRLWARRWRAPARRAGF
jgi:hypothetical protein